MNILYVTTISNTINAFLYPHIKLLIEDGHQVDIATNIIQDIDSKIYGLGCTIHHIEFQRSPFSKKNYYSFIKIKKLLKKQKYDVIHVHTPVASMIVRLACIKEKNVKVIYTAHGFHFFKGASLLSWMIYYPVEHFLSRFTDVLITINDEDFNRSKGFKAKKVEYVPGVGIDIQRYKNIKVNKKIKKREISIPENSFVILSVGELNINKNHEVIIRTIAKLNNPNVFYIICGVGNLEQYLNQLSKSLGISNNVKFLGFRKDIIEICNIADIFAFPSYREGLPVSLMEAMVTGLPVVCSNIRGNQDLIKDGINGYLVNPKKTEGFERVIKYFINNSLEKVRFTEANEEIIENFDIKKVEKKLKEIYGRVI